MDFSLSEEQSMLQDSIARFIASDYSFAERQKLIHQDPGFSEAHWQTYARLGWLGVPLPRDYGGIGGGSVDAAILMEQFGKGLVVEPYVPTVVLAGAALRIAGSPAQKEHHLPAIAAGDCQAALAFAEPQSRYNLANVETAAVQSRDGWIIDGHKSVVLNGPAADWFVVSARSSGAALDREGISLFLVPASSEGLERRDFRTVDGQRAAELYFRQVRLPSDALLGERDRGLPVLEQVIDEAIVAVGAEAIGAMEVLCAQTVDYCKTRKQFDQPLAAFQVLQHRMVDMFMEYEQAKSLMYMAAMRMDEGYGPEAQKAVSAFKVQLWRSARFVGQNAIQLHGGMGMTDELAVGHYFKRLTAINASFGDHDYHLRRYGAL